MLASSDSHGTLALAIQRTAAVAYPQVYDGEVDLHHQFVLIL
jgi:hypothetical protein